MKKLHFLLIASVLAISGIFAILTKQIPSHMSRREVPERPSQRGIASAKEGISSQAAALSVRPSIESLPGLKITEAQIHMMEEHLSDLQQDVSVFKDRGGWLVHFHHPSMLMASLGVKDADLISFKQLQELKSEPALEPLVGRLEIIFIHLQK